MAADWNRSNRDHVTHNLYGRRVAIQKITCYNQNCNEITPFVHVGESQMIRSNQTFMMKSATHRTKHRQNHQDRTNKRIACQDLDARG